MTKAFNNASFPIARFAATFTAAVAAAPHELIRLGRALANGAEFFEDAAFLTSYGDHHHAGAMLATCRRFIEEALAVLDAFPASPAPTWREGVA